jgi:hypothetical protein
MGVGNKQLRAATGTETNAHGTMVKTAPASKAGRPEDGHRGLRWGFRGPVTAAGALAAVMLAGTACLPQPDGPVNQATKGTRVDAPTGASSSTALPSPAAPGDPRSVPPHGAPTAPGDPGSARPHGSPTTPDTAPARPGIRSLDVAGLSIPSSLCEAKDHTDLRPAAAPVGADLTAATPNPTVPGGAPSSSRTPMSLRLGTVVYGDVTGDGVEDAVVVVKCMFGGRLDSQYWGRAFIVDGASSQPSAGPVLAASGAALEADDVPSANGGGTATTGHERLYESMVDLRIDNGAIVTSWTQTANPVIPRLNQSSRRVLSRHHVRDGSLVTTGTPEIQAWSSDRNGSVEPFGPTAW